MAKVSVLMPVYNAERFLAESIGSILSQTFSDWELIIINDGSTDKSAEICKSYSDKRIKYFENEKNIKLIATLNKGIKYCNGTYIARMDADDVCLPHRFEKQVKFLDTHPDYIMVGTNASIIDQKGHICGKIMNLTSNRFLQINLLFSTSFVHPSMMIRAEILKQNEYSTDYIHSEDQELWMRLSRLGKIANINSKLIKYRIHDTNVSVEYASIQQQNNFLLAAGELKKLGISPNEQQLYLHKLSFELYSNHNKSSVSQSRDEVESDVNKWFSLLVKKNKEKNIYPDSVFQAFLWSRWTVLCVYNKKYIKALKPQFVALNWRVLLNYFQLSLYLFRKK